MVANIYWGDGTSDVITVTYTGQVGSSQLTVEASPNMTLFNRIKEIKLMSSSGIQIGTVTVTQEAQAGAFSAGFSSGFN
jgi:uncharacterized protein (DUF1786 family)